MSTNPSQLYHYTSQRGAIGIATTKRLWASNIRYLNDATEFLHSVHVATLVSEELSDLTPPERDFLRFLLGTSEVGAFIRSWEFGVQYYVVSLTEEPDLLSQWRAYAPKSGYCIGWSFRAIATNAERNGFELSPCVYDMEVQRQMIRPVIERSIGRWRSETPAVSFADNFWAPRNEAEIQAFSLLNRHKRDFDSEFGKIATVCKNPAFKEEKEWRLVSHEYPRGRAPTVEFREGRSVLIPYIGFEIMLDGSAPEDKMTTIVCGPSPEIELSQRSAMNLFGANAWLNVQSMRSSTPYRDW